LSNDDDREHERHCHRTQEETATLLNERPERGAGLVGAQPFVVARLRPLLVHALPLSCIR
jgi:hypothetical protein